MVDICLNKNVKLFPENQVNFANYNVSVLKIHKIEGIVTEIFYGWVGGYPYLQAPLYGSVSHLPATTSWVKVIHDDHDPMCVH